MRRYGRLPILFWSQVIYFILIVIHYLMPCSYWRWDFLLATPWRLISKPLQVSFFTRFFVLEALVWPVTTSISLLDRILWVIYVVHIFDYLSEFPSQDMSSGYCEQYISIFPCHLLKTCYSGSLCGYWYVPIPSASPKGTYYIPATKCFQWWLEYLQINIWTMGFIVAPHLSPFAFGFFVARARCDSESLDHFYPTIYMCVCSNPR